MTSSCARGRRCRGDVETEARNAAEPSTTGMASARSHTAPFRPLWRHGWLGHRESVDFDFFPIGPSARSSCFARSLTWRISAPLSRPKTRWRAASKRLRAKSRSAFSAACRCGRSRRPITPKATESPSRRCWTCSERTASRSRSAARAKTTWMYTRVDEDELDLAGRHCGGACDLPTPIRSHDDFACACVFRRSVNRSPRPRKRICSLPPAAYRSRTFRC